MKDFRFALRRRYPTWQAVLMGILGRGHLPGDLVVCDARAASKSGSSRLRKGCRARRKPSGAFRACGLIERSPATC